MRKISGSVISQIRWQNRVRSVDFSCAEPTRTAVVAATSLQQTTLRRLRQGFRSAATSNYVKPRLRTKFGESAFSFAGPHAWNKLPAALHATSNLNAFKKQLKTHLFNIAFSQ